MFGQKKSQRPVSAKNAMSLEEILGCDELEPPESRVQRATFVELFTARDAAQMEVSKGNAAGSGAMSLLSEEAVCRDIEHRYLLGMMLQLNQDSIGGVFEAYETSKEFFGEERCRELRRLSIKVCDWISAITLINRALKQDLRLFSEINKGETDDDR